MKKRFTEAQIIQILKEAEAGMPVKELCRKHGFSDASFYVWRAKYGGMDVAEAKRLKALEQENARLKKLLADTMLDKEALEAALRKKYCPHRCGARRFGRCELRPRYPNDRPAAWWGFTAAPCAMRRSRRWRRRR